MTLSYHPTWDTTAIIITAVVSLICIVLIYAGLFHYASFTRWLLIIGLPLGVGLIFLFPYRETFDPDREEITLHFIGHSRTNTQES